MNNLIRISTDSTFSVYYDKDKGMYCVVVDGLDDFKAEHWFDAYEEKELLKTGIAGMFEGTIIRCENCDHAKPSWNHGDDLVCPMWGNVVVGLNPNGFCHMWCKKRK